MKSNKLKLWVEGARLRTLPLAIAPVAIGAGAADSVQAFDPKLFGASVLTEVVIYATLKSGHTTHRSAAHTLHLDESMAIEYFSEFFRCPERHG